MSSRFLLFQFMSFLMVLCNTLSAKHCSSDRVKSARDFKTETPIKYLVLIIPEDVTFDTYFSTYPHALNPSNQTKFKAKSNTPLVNGLNKPLLTHNTNLVAPFRLNPNEIVSAPIHDYTSMQAQANGGLMDKFVEAGGISSVMGYYDGNAVTALWNYAQRFAMSDNCFCTTFGGSTPGHINIVSGQTHGAIPANIPDVITPGSAIFIIDGTIISSGVQPLFDKCSTSRTAELTGQNIGNLLNAKDITWGYFAGGFRDCNQGHIGTNGEFVPDYTPRHNAFQYYASTSNPDHLPPSSPEMIGYTDQANHLYDLEDFWEAVAIHNVPAVSILKQPAYQSGHRGESSPAALQTFLVETINSLQKTREWREMAIIVMWDDGGGLYDHVMPPIINQSNTAADVLLGPGNAGNPPPGSYLARLGYGPRIPFLVISPFAKENFVDHTVIDQTSVISFIEDNWGLGRIGDQSFDAFAGSLENIFNFKQPNYHKFLLDPNTGSKIKERRGIHFKPR